MSSDPNIKQVRLVQVKGVAATEEGGEDDSFEGQEGGAAGTRKRVSGGRKRMNHKTFKVGVITKEGGGSTSPGTMTQLAASRVPGPAAAAAVQAVGVDSALTQRGAPVGGGKAAAASPAPTAAPVVGGAVASVKVVLAAPKKKGKVVLAAAAAPKAPVVAGAAAAKTRKHKGGARKIKVSMSSLSKKIHRAKTIRHKATEDTIAEVKKALHKAGLIKADSKAPEPILRQMYADFMTLKNRAL